MKNLLFLSFLVFALSGCTLIPGNSGNSSIASQESQVSIISDDSEESISAEESFSESFSSFELSSYSSYSSFSSIEPSSDTSSFTTSEVSESISNSSVDENPIVKLDFYNINDLHGTIEYNRSLNEPGISRLSSFLKSEKSKNPDGFVLTSSGDMWQGSALSNMYKGAAINEWMNYLDFSCMALGNHEFDWSVDIIKNNMASLNFPVISSNIIDKDSRNNVDWIQPTTIKEVSGVKVGFVGAIGAGQTSDILASISHVLDFPDPTSYVVSAAQKLRQDGADVIVLLLHDETSEVTSQMASYSDVIFCGHSHQREVKKVYNVPAVQSQANGKYVSHISITFNKDTKTVTYGTYEAIDLRNKSLSTDNGTNAIIDKYLTTEVKNKLENPLGSLSSSLSQSVQSELMTEYMYQYYVDNYNEYTIYGANHNNARSAMSAGTITYKDVFKSFPFDNNLVVMKLKGKALKTITYGTFYIPNQETLVDNKDYYIFTIDYIAEYDVYYSPSLGVEIVQRFTDIYPRDVFSIYFARDYGQ